MSNIIYAIYISGRSSRLLEFIRGYGRIARERIGVVISDTIIDDELKEKLILTNISICAYEEHSASDFSDFMLNALREYDIDYCFSFGSSILKGKILEVYKNRIINFQPSILPMYPGINAIDQAYKSEKETFLIGNTAHFIDEGIDTGDIIMQSVIPIRAYNDTKDYDVVLNLQIEMLVQLINIIDNNRLFQKDGKPYIEGADYFRSTIYPYIE